MLDDGKDEREIFVNFKMEFDNVDYNILPTKLENYGIRRISNKWFASHIRNRKKICKFIV